ncbi:MAG: phosphoethanolamine transferase [Prevotella sp.]|nr:phosphoethanolamine transferase [Prevotella sp.]
MTTYLWTIFRLFFKPVKGWVFLYLLLLNLVSNCVASYVFHGAWPLLQMVLLSFVSAYIENAAYVLLAFKPLRRLYLGMMALIHNILIVADYFVVFSFQKIVNQDIVDILAETNSAEIENFAGSYLQWPVIFVWVLGLTVLNFCLVKTSRRISRMRYHLVAGICSAAGMLLCGHTMFSYLMYHNGNAVPQYHAFTRVAYASYVMKQREGKIELLGKVARELEASAPEDAPNMVVIVGESYSVYHSSLYGYRQLTSPYLEHRRQNGELAVFDDVVSVADATHAVMQSVFSLDSLGIDFESKPLFPMCFKSAGYHTLMYDNQYFIGNGITFLSDEKLSGMMFDVRNGKRYGYDGDMVKDMENSPSPYLYVIHLWGQHYTYSERYPSEFSCFSADDYDKTAWDASQREVIAHYDNAMRYNDFVINEIIKRFENDDCCIVYFADHGEEVYDYRNYMGHGNAHLTSQKQYQIRVPLMIWTSSSFREKHPNLASQIQSSAHAPVTTDDISHLILDIAGIKTECFSASRSAINPNYNSEKPRIILHSLDYDKDCR